MHIRRSTIVICLGVGVFLSVILLLSAGWVRSSFAPDWNLRDWSSRGGWNSWKDYLPGKGGSNSAGGSKSTGGSPAEGAPIGEQPGITPTPDKGNGTGRLYPEINIKDDNLRKRLGELLARPVWSHEEALERNVQKCPIKVADKQVNQDQLKGNSDGWMRITNTEITKRRKDIVAYLEQVEKSGTQLVANSWVQKGRGIVMTGGNQDTVQRILVALRILRHEHKCKLAVEVFSFPGEIKNQDRIRELGDLGATVREIKGFEKVQGAWKNFQIKAAAIAGSSFREVLYLDSDNIPLSDPSLLFDEPRYREGGRAVFWPDFNKDHPQNAIWRVLGVECNYNEWEVESGQMLIDKRGNDGLNLAALHIAAHMSHEQSFYYTLSGGDKDTFRYAFWALGIDYTPAPRWLSSLGNQQYDRFCGIAMLQYGLSKTPKPAFAHLNLLKHTFRMKPVFTTIKRPLFDLARSRSLDGTTINVYTPPTGGMCVEVKVDGPGDQLLIEETWEEGEYEWFEETYFKHGGLAGGW